MKQNISSLKARAQRIVILLENEYPDPLCTLDYAFDWQLLFSTRLAAQCTDARVNKVTKVLYRRFPDLLSFAAAPLEAVEEIVKPCGLFHTKSRDLIAAAQTLLSRFNGTVPGTMEELLTIPGIGRKTANIVLGDLYGKPAVAADTHCIRLSNRMGLCNTKDPYKVELALSAIVRPDKQSAFCHRLVLHGRAVCTARNPRCAACCCAELCPSYIKKLS